MTYPVSFYVSVIFVRGYLLTLNAVNAKSLRHMLCISPIFHYVFFLGSCTDKPQVIKATKRSDVI